MVGPLSNGPLPWLHPIPPPPPPLPGSPPRAVCPPQPALPWPHGPGLSGEDYTPLHLLHDALDELDQQPFLEKPQLRGLPAVPFRGPPAAGVQEASLLLERVLGRLISPHQFSACADGATLAALLPQSLD